MHFRQPDIDSEPSRGLNVPTGQAIGNLSSNTGLKGQYMPLGQIEQTAEGAEDVV